VDFKSTANPQQIHSFSTTFRQIHNISTCKDVVDLLRTLQQIHNKSKSCTTNPQQFHNKSNKWSLSLTAQQSTQTDLLWSFTIPIHTKHSFNRLRFMSSSTCNWTVFIGPRSLVHKYQKCIAWMRQLLTTSASTLGYYSFEMLLTDWRRIIKLKLLFMSILSVFVILLVE
jgi:hypothetical protein